jgi:hypothetical protein
MLTKFGGSFVLKIGKKDLILSKYEAHDFQPGLPDGTFACQKFLFWSVLESFGTENVGIFYDHLIFYDHFAYFIIIWYILWLFGILFSVLVCCTTKSLATLFSAILQTFHQKMAIF